MKALVKAESAPGGAADRDGVALGLPSAAARHLDNASTLRRLGSSMLCASCAPGKAFQSHKG